MRFKRKVMMIERRLKPRGWCRCSRPLVFCNPPWLNIEGPLPQAPKKPPLCERCGCARMCITIEFVDMMNRPQGAFGLGVRSPSLSWDR